ncbi:hypothetical protein GGR58DRAFT_505784 [Xylaria digitata]|nr:hypothetical protein GGR58DRAFT_505784 [Xylaria digitata]
MDRQPNKDDHPTPHAPVALKRGTEFDNPGLDNYTPVREIYLQKNMEDSPTKRPPKADRDMYQFEDYLRNKWGCTDAMPDPFDPEKLDAVLRSRFPARRKNRYERLRETGKSIVETQDHDLIAAPRESQGTPLEDAYTRSPNSIYPCGYNVSTESPSTKSSHGFLDTCERDGHVSEVLTSDDETSENITPVRARSGSNASSRRGRTMSETQERQSTPRIRAGSKPPLSRSAFVEGGVPCLDEQCQGAYKHGVIVKGHSQPPPYFPFANRRRRPSRSRSRGNSESAERVDVRKPLQ